MRRRHPRAPDPDTTTSGRPRRGFLLGIAREFVLAARGLPGVSRIALIGSILTDKCNPKDIDLLVTIADGTDLAELARHGRRLSGRAQSEGVGGEVFLADPRQHYIGRICQWRECWRRVLCDARNCGKRPHLHDDLGNITLPADLTRDPPLILWPDTIERVAVPADVRAVLLNVVETGGPRSSTEPPLGLDPASARECRPETAMRNLRPAQAILQLADRIRGIVGSHRAGNPRVFGSVARGDDADGSDLDVLVDPMPAMSLFDLIRIERELQQLLRMRVEVFTPKTLRASVRSAALREARPI